MAGEASVVPYIGCGSELGSDGVFKEARGSLNNLSNAEPLRLKALAGE